MKTQIGWTKMAWTLVTALVLGLIIYPHQRREKKVAADTATLRGRLLGNKNYRNFEVGLEEYNISLVDHGEIEVELRDRRVCHGSTNPDDVCTAIIWRMDVHGKFISRETYNFNHGINVGVGRIDSIGPKEDYRQVASYGIGNAIPYTFQVYPYSPKDRRLYYFQQQIDALLKDIPPAA